MEDAHEMYDVRVFMAGNVLMPKLLIIVLHYMY